MIFHYMEPDPIVASYLQHKDMCTGVATLYPLLRADVEDASVDIWSRIKRQIERLHADEAGAIYLEAMKPEPTES